MRVALLTTFGASKKEPLAVLVERIRVAFLESGQGEPEVRFSLADAPLPGFVSSVDRVVKRFPALERFVSDGAAMPGGPAVRMISNGPTSPAAGEAVEFGTLQAIAEGVPRSFPFHSAQFCLRSAAFGELSGGSVGGATTSGVFVGDSWWVSGRSRSLMVVYTVEGEAGAKKLPAPSEAVTAILGACGKAKSTVQLPLAEGSAAAPMGLPVARAAPAVAEAVVAIVRDYRARLGEVVERAGMPHDLPPAAELLASGRLGEKSGPKKPALAAAFKALGYDCTGGSGTFTLRRRTAGNLTVEISLDVGTWSNSLTGHFQVQGLGFNAILPMPVSRRAVGSLQYPIGGSERWGQIVENLAALVKELDRSFVTAVEAAAGETPAWYRPES